MEHAIPVLGAGESFRACTLPAPTSSVKIYWSDSAPCTWLYVIFCWWCALPNGICSRSWIWWLFHVDQQSECELQDTNDNAVHGHLCCIWLHQLHVDADFLLEIKGVIDHLNQLCQDIICVGTLPKGYIRNIPLPRVPQVQITQSHWATKIPDYYEDICLVPTYNSPCSIVESAAFAVSPAWRALAINN